MTKAQRITLFLLRISLGWLFLYSGITKILDPSWSAVGYLSGAKMLPGLFAWFASPEVLPIVNILNSWGQLLIGSALLLGVGVRIASVSGILMMALYYLPILDFPYPNAHSLLVDEHVVYAAGLAMLMAYRAGTVWGLTRWCANLPLCRRFPNLHSLAQ